MSDSRCVLATAVGSRWVLPWVMSDLLEITLNDVEIAKNTPNVLLDMHTWYRRDEQGTCVVCMAGAVMMNHGLIPDISDAPITVTPGNEEVSRQLHAIDLMRIGAFFAAAFQLRVALSDRQLKAVRRISLAVGFELSVADHAGMAPMETYRQAVIDLRAEGL